MGTAIDRHPGGSRGRARARGLALVLPSVLAVAIAACGQASPTVVTSAASRPPSSAVSATPSIERGVWRLLPPSPLRMPMDGSITGAWDGKELFISGRVCRDRWFAQTAAFDPGADTWRMLPRYRRPDGCFEEGDTAVWDGDELLLIGVTNAAYDPSTNRWRSLHHDPTRAGDIAVWTGRQTLGYGGGCCGEPGEATADCTRRAWTRGRTRRTDRSWDGTAPPASGTAGN